jgi:hypothetical protein
MSNSNTIKQDGKTYEQVRYEVGEAIRNGAMLFVNAELVASSSIGAECSVGMSDQYWHEMEATKVPVTVEHEGKTYERHGYKAGEIIRDGAMLSHTGAWLKLSSFIGRECPAGGEDCYYHEVEPEMVTITYRVKPDQADSIERGQSNPGRSLLTDASAERIRAARKTKLERWRERVGADMTQGEELELYEHLGGHCGFGEKTAKLLAAALKLAEALIELRGESSWKDHSSACLDRVAKAIKAAFPADVAAEILGETPSE